MTSLAAGLVSRSTTATALARKHAHPRDAAIEFQEDIHGYFVTAADGTRRQCGLSVTGLINTVIRDPFDAPAVAAKLAARPSRKYNAGVGPDGRFLPLTAEAILASWDARRDLGTDLHGKIELYLNGTPEAELFGGFVADTADTDTMAETGDVADAALPSPPVNYPEFQQFKRWFDACGLEAYRTEWVIYDTSADIAGSVDFVGRNPVTGNYVIVDWKRCAHGDGESGFSSNYHGATMLPPAQALEECKLSHWAIQVNVYRCILETNYGITVERMLMLALYPGQEQAVEYEHARDDSVAAALLQARRDAVSASAPTAP
jgi:hypothetical protein